MAAAQHAPIGAKICTAKANRTMGRKFFSRPRPRHQGNYAKRAAEHEQARATPAMITVHLTIPTPALLAGL